MIDEQGDNQSISKANKNLDRRLAKSPRVYQRLHQIADAMEEAIASGLTADEAEEMAIKQVNELGNAMIGDWAQAQEQISVERAQAKDPHLTKDTKKTLVAQHLRSHLNRTNALTDWSTRQTSQTLLPGQRNSPSGLLLTACLLYTSPSPRDDT